jgi:preprotein translocase subunit Sec63
MRLDDCYRLLDLDRRATAEEIKRAHRDLTKVWHPDRFGHDAALRRKAEEKLKAINEAYEMIMASHPEDHFVHDDPVDDPEDDAEAHAILTRRRVARIRNYALACALLAIFILLRRPTPAGLVIALVLFVVAVVFVVRLRSIFLDSRRPNL